jgi:hypothetical protein
MFKDPLFKSHVLKSLEIVTKCLHKDHLEKDFNFTYKPKILAQILVSRFI